VSALPIANADRRTTQCLTSDSFAFRKLLYSCREGMCHSSTHPGTALHLTQFYQAFPMLVLQATNAGVRIPGYEATQLTY